MTWHLFWTIAGYVGAFYAGGVACTAISSRNDGPGGALIVGLLWPLWAINAAFGG